MRARIRHELKCWPEFFEPTMRATKRFELRRDDREGGFQVGDELLLKEWGHGLLHRFFGDQSLCYTGREVLLRVDYIMDAETLEILMRGDNQRFFSPTPPGFVIMSVSRVN